MIRHCRGRQELHQRIATDRLVIVAMRAYRMSGARLGKTQVRLDKRTLYQIQRFHAFLWASGGVTATITFTRSTSVRG